MYALTYLTYIPNLFIQYFEANRESEECEFANEVHEKMDSLYQKESIRKDLIIEETISKTVGQMFGSNIEKTGKAKIHLPLFLYRDDKEAFYFLYKHELSHVKHNDNLVLSMAGTLSILVSSFAISYFSNNLLLHNFGCQAIGLLGFLFYSRYAEARADRFAIQNSSDRELEGGIRLFQEYLGLEFKGANRHLRWVHDAKGNYLLDIFHPSLSSRIQTIQRELQLRNKKHK